MTHEEGPRDEGSSYEILRSIRRIIRKVSDHSRMMSREVGLTVPQLLCLKAVGDAQEDEVTPALVSQRVHLSPATVSGILDRLERDGLVVRERRSRDRRKVCLSMTPRGAELFTHLPTPLQDAFLRRLSRLDATERVALLDALQRVVDLMEAGDIDASPILTTDEISQST
ncbi:MAG: MarR family transcriptional regulator [Myxococcales bacterium]